MTASSSTESPHPSIFGAEIYTESRGAIEMDGETVGVVTARDGDVVFHAAVPETWPIDCCRFASRQDAIDAVRELLRMR